MTKRHGLLLGVLLLFLILWSIWGPLPLGGSSTYLSVSGQSMLPTYHAGDLVVVRKSQTYRVGDVVAYRDPVLNRIILHRIVGTDGPRYLMKGDHNAWVDPYLPSREDIYGKAVLHRPGAARYLAWVQKPAGYLAFLAVVAFVWIFWELRHVGLQERRRRRLQRPREALKEREVSPLASPFRSAFYTALLLGIFLLGLSFYWARTPQTESIIQVLTYTQRGTFSYEGSAPKGAAYPDGKVKTEDPLFLGILSSVLVNFSYEVGGYPLEKAQGEGQMVALLRGQSGWSRAYPLVEPFTFEGTSARLEGILPLAEMKKDVEALQAETGYRLDRYTLTIQPKILQKGSLAGTPVESLFAPELSFDWEALLAKLSVTDPQKLTAALEPEKTGNLSLTTPVPRHLRVLGWEPPVSVAWRTALIAALLLFLASGFFYWQWRKDLVLDPLSLWRKRAGHLWVESQGLHLLSDQEGVVWLGDFESILKVARDYERFLFHEELEDGQHFFLVRDVDATYAFRGRPQSEKPLFQLKSITKEVP
ncbi:MAG: signal peptidase I [Clostridiales bacterium]|nr:signal peptidase I [Clostridiales bacterium]